MHPTNRTTDFVQGGFPLKVAVTSGCRPYQNYSVGENEEDELGETTGTRVEMRNAYRVAVQKPEVKTPLGRPWREWESNITVDLKRISWKNAEWGNVAQDREK